MEVAEHTEDIGAAPVFWRAAGAAEAPVLYLHGVPDHSHSWLPFLERGGGIAPDLPGFGRSAKRADFDYSIRGYDLFLERFLAHLGVECVRLVVHDWGAAGLAWAQRFPERVERLVVIDAVPLLPGYRWHRTARVWRTPVLGELSMGATTKRLMRLSLREATPRPGSLPDPWVDAIYEHFDQGTQRAILKLYRASPPTALAEAGRRLGELRCPTLVLWGAQDPYLPTRFAHAYGEALGGQAEVEVVDGAGHWPWLDRPELVERIVDFATG